MPRSTKDFKVAIVGGGMSGLALAVGLTRVGLEVEIYEAAAKFGEIGAGVGFGPNGIRVLQELDILDEVLSRSDQEKPEVRPFRYLFGVGEHEHIYDYPVLPEDVGLGIHRAAFLDALVHLVDPSKTNFNKRCVSLATSQKSSRIQVNFADGTNTEADIVFGADGIKSVVRTFVVEGDEHEEVSAVPVRTAFTNTIAYRALVPSKKLKEIGVKTDMVARPHGWIGPDKHIITFAIKGGELINVVAFACDRSISWGARPLPIGHPWVAPRTNAELLAEYEGWGPDIQLLLSCIPQPSVWSIHAVHSPLESYSRGRAALLGDAAHGMLPHLGAGAGQGLEDVLVLVKLLGHPNATNENIESILQAYDMVRRPRANLILALSTKSGDIYEGYGPSGYSKEGLIEDISGIWDKTWHHDLQADIDEAIKWLQDEGVF